MPGNAMRAPWTLLFGSLLAGCSTDLDIDGKSPNTIDQPDIPDTGDIGGGSGTTDTDTADDTGDDIPPEEDGDGDGWLPSEGDCDDTNPDVHPGAEELCNGIDDDCDGTSDLDWDDDHDGVADCADSCPVQVASATVGSPDGTWSAPFPAIQDGIDHAWTNGCDTVEVAQGVYYENVDYGGAPIYVRSHDGPEVTLIDGQAAGPVVTFATAEDRSAGLDGFTVTNGLAALGAGIYVDSADPTIIGNIIEANATTSGGGGGGIGMSNASPLIEANTIRDNDACFGGPEEGCDGGGINIRTGAPDIFSNTIQANGAGDGGGIWMVRSDALMYWNYIISNLADDTDPTSGGQGGGVDIQVPSAGTVLTNNVIADNVASTHGGGVVIFEAGSAGEAVVQHNVIAWNTVTDTDYGAGIAIWQYTSPLVRNNVVVYNTGSGIYSNSTGDIRYNLVYSNTTNWAGDQGSLTGVNGNLATDPVVTSVTHNADFTDDDWHPASGSPLINAGDPASSSDSDGSAADIGAHGGSLGVW